MNRKLTLSTLNCHAARVLAYTVLSAICIIVALIGGEQGHLVLSTFFAICFAIPAIGEWSRLARHVMSHPSRGLLIATGLGALASSGIAADLVVRVIYYYINFSPR